MSRTRPTRFRACPLLRLRKECLVYTLQPEPVGRGDGGLYETLSPYSTKTADLDRAINDAEFSPFREGKSRSDSWMKVQRYIGGISQAMRVVLAVRWEYS